MSASETTLIPPPLIEVGEYDSVDPRYVTSITYFLSTKRSCVSESFHKLSIGVGENRIIVAEFPSKEAALVVKKKIEDARNGHWMMKSTNNHGDPDASSP